METYEKKYKDAQKWVESIYTELSHERQMEAEALFPELAESEDERIRKELLTFLDELSKLGKSMKFDRWSTSDVAKWGYLVSKQGQACNQIQIHCATYQKIIRNQSLKSVIGSYIMMLMCIKLKG